MKSNDQTPDENRETDVLYESGKNIATTILENAAAARDVLKIASEGTTFAEYVTERMDEQLDDPRKPECGPGCPYCCSMQISITPPEALLLGDYVENNYDDGERAALLSRIENNLALTHDRSQGEKVRNWHLTPCVFLVDGSCSVYPIRPFICRSWHSLNKAQCLDAFHSRKEDAEIENLPHRNYIFGTIRDGIQEGLREKGLQWETHIITSAVKSHLNHEDPVSAWLRGETVFFRG